MVTASANAMRDAAALTSMSVEQVRSLLRVDARSLEPRFTDRVLFVIWAIVSVVVFLAPLALVFAGVRLLIGLIAR